MWLSWPMARSRSRTRRAESPMASPRCAAGSHWLTITGAPHHARRRHDAPHPARRTRHPALSAHVGKSVEDRRAEHPQLFEPLVGAQLIPEVERDVRLGATWRGGDAVDEAQQRPAEVPSEQIGRARHPGPRATLSAIALIRQHGVDQRRDMVRVPVLVQHAAAVERGGHGGGGVEPLRARACGTPRPAGRRSLRARSRTGTGRRRRSTPSAPRC